jgi:hypothetical protein
MHTPRGADCKSVGVCLPRFESWICHNSSAGTLCPLEWVWAAVQSAVVVAAASSAASDEKSYSCSCEQFLHVLISFDSCDLGDLHFDLGAFLNEMAKGTCRWASGKSRCVEILLRLFMDVVGLASCTYAEYRLGMP